MGHEIPAPGASENYSGRVVLRLPKSLHRRAAELAKHDGISLNQFLVAAVAEHVGTKNLCEQMTQRLEKRARDVGEVERRAQQARALLAAEFAALGSTYPAPIESNIIGGGSLQGITVMSIPNRPHFPDTWEPFNVEAHHGAGYEAGEIDVGPAVFASGNMSNRPKRKTAAS